MQGPVRRGTVHPRGLRERMGLFVLKERAFWGMKCREEQLVIF